MTNKYMYTNYFNYLNDKCSERTIGNNDIAHSINKYSSTVNSMSNKPYVYENKCNRDIEKLISDPLINRKDLTMLLRKRMFNNSNVLKYMDDDILTNSSNTSVRNDNATNKSIQTEIIDSDYKFDLLHNDNKSIDMIDNAKSPFVIRDSIKGVNKIVNNDDNIICMLNRKELGQLQITKCGGDRCWESLLLELYNIPFELSDCKLENMFRVCKFKVINLQREQHLFNRPSNATICISYNTDDLKVLDIGDVLASKSILMHLKQIITY